MVYFTILSTPERIANLPYDFLLELVSVGAFLKKAPTHGGALFNFFLVTVILITGIVSFAMMYLAY